MTSTTADDSSRSPGLPRRASAKSAIVYDPYRRSGAATNRSSARYPAAKPTACHSAPAPTLSVRPAMPRKLAADRYSPEIAPAFHQVETDREATKRSDVVRATRTPGDAQAHRDEHHGGDHRKRDHSPRTSVRKASSIASARRAVDPADDDEERERRHGDEQVGERDPAERDALQAARQQEHERQRAEQAAEGDEGHERQGELRPHQPAQVDAAVRGRVGELVAGGARPRPRVAHTRSLRSRSGKLRRATGTSLPSAITSAAVPFSCGRTSTARRRLTT